MCDEEDGDPGLLELPHLTEKALDLVCGKRGRWLVHDQDLDLERYRLGDLDCLLAGDGEAGSGEPGVEVDVQGRQDLLCIPGHGGASPRPSPRSWCPMKMFSATLRSGNTEGSW